MMPKVKATLPYSRSYDFIISINSLACLLCLFPCISSAAVKISHGTGNAVVSAHLSKLQLKDAVHDLTLVVVHRHGCVLGSPSGGAFSATHHTQALKKKT